MQLAKTLHKIGQSAFDRPWRFVASWTVLLVLVAGAAVQFMQPTSSAITIPGTKAQIAIDRANELFPSSGEGSGQIVFHAKNGGSITDHQSEISQLVKDVSGVDGVTGVVGPFQQPTQLISNGGSIAYAIVQLDQPVGSVEKATLTAVDESIETASSSTLQVEKGGGLINDLPESLVGVGEIFGLMLALIVLIVTLASLVAAGLPIVVALVSVGASTAGLFALSHFITINSTTPVLAIMLGLAVGIDYSLFIINRYRMLLLDGMTPHKAIGRAMGTAGNAVVFAAATVVIALAALSVVQIPFMTTMGLAGAASVATAAVVALTLLPALLGLAGMKILGKKARRKALAAQKLGSQKPHKIDTKTFWHRWGETITRRPWLTLVISLVVVAVLAWPAGSLKLGLPTDQYRPENSTGHQAYELISKGFGVGYNGQIAVLVEDMPPAGAEEKAAIRAQAEKQFQQRVAEKTQQAKKQFAQKIAAADTMQEKLLVQQQIAALQAQAATKQQAAQKKIDQAVETNAKFVHLKKIADQIATLDNVKATLPAAALDNGTAGIIQVIPNSAPSDDATLQLIETLRRDDTAATLTPDSDATLAVTGVTAIQADINAKLTAALPIYMAVVVGLSFVILVLAFRSILVPIKATLGFLLSVAVMFGVMVAIFQWGWFGIATAPGIIVSFVPIIAIGILFGLAMDYEFFLVSSMHEVYGQTHDAKKAVVDGFGMASRVVTAAGIIMVSIFAGFVGSEQAVVQTIGLGLAAGILVDAFLVRMTIVPAVMTLLGKSAWWLPAWLRKHLPHISIEGEK